MVQSAVEETIVPLLTWNTIFRAAQGSQTDPALAGADRVIIHIAGYAAISISVRMR